MSNIKQVISKILVVLVIALSLLWFSAIDNSHDPGTLKSDFDKYNLKSRK